LPGGVQGASGWIGGRSLRAICPGTSAGATTLHGDAGEEQPESEPSSKISDDLGGSIGNIPNKSREYPRFENEKMVTLWDKFKVKVGYSIDEN